MQQNPEQDLATRPDFAVEPLEELDAPGFMDGLGTGITIVGGGAAILEAAGVIALT
ncbi:hypothetical protein AB0C76_23150 [Kitasatospora sp. NPDC048722]|uniref:hypothetical protein n=1 Tax=Kitasatospora sp. NPDC048722 TaxID=3155639 RepID=UPI0033F1CA1E